MSFIQMTTRNSDPVSVSIDQYVQTQFLKEKWGEYQVNIFEGKLIVKGNYTRSCYFHKYEFIVGYNPYNYQTFSYIMTPTIDPNPYIHVNGDGSLCLYNAAAYPFHKKFLLATEIIPWTIEWTLWYEKYLVNGFKWEGP